jgi:L-malate glycosyltransferase
LTRKISTSKIWFLATWYPTPIDPLRGIFIQRHAEAISHYSKIAVLHIYRTNKPGWFSLKPQIINKLGFSEILIAVNTPSFFLFKITGFIIALIKGYKILKINVGKPDLIHVNVLTRMGLMAYMMKIFHKIPYIITEHWSRYQKGNDIYYRGKIRKWLTKKIVSNASQVTTVTKHLALAMQDQGLKNTYSIIPNVVDTELFNLKKPQNKSTHFKLIHISSFVEKAKNIRNLLDAVKIAHDTNQDIRLDLIGDGVDFNLVKAYANKIPGNLGFIHFMGILTGQKLVNAIQQSDVLIISSDYENLPCVITEAMACGLPIISTDVGGIHEHITNEYGILVPPRDSEKLSKAILIMVNRAGQFDPINIRKYAVEQFSYESIGKMYLEIYNTLIRK